MLHQFGTYFQHAFPELDVYPGELSMGFQYNYANDNQYLPIIRFADSGLQKVNPTDRIERLPHRWTVEELEEQDD